MPFGGLLTVGLIAAGGSIASGLIESNATGNAADLTKQSADNSLAFQQSVFDTQQKNAAPWLDAGKTALGQLATGTADGGKFMQPYGKEFTSPTGVDESNDPGYQFRLQQGRQALERSAAAKGTATGGAALKAAARYGQDYASNEYSNVYNRALQNFGTNYNIWNADTANQFNRLSALSGFGQTANGQANASGNAAAGNVAGINTNTGNQLSSLATQGGSSLAAGVLGAGSALTNGVNSYQNNQLLQKLLAGQSTGSGYDNSWMQNGIG